MAHRARATPESHGAKIEKSRKPGQSVHIPRRRHLPQCVFFPWAQIEIFFTQLLEATENAAPGHDLARMPPQPVMDKYLKKLHRSVAQKRPINRRFGSFIAITNTFWPGRTVINRVLRFHPACFLSPFRPVVTSTPWPGKIEITRVLRFTLLLGCGMINTSTTTVFK